MIWMDLRKRRWPKRSESRSFERVLRWVLIYSLCVFAERGCEISYIYFPKRRKWTSLWEGFWSVLFVSLLKKDIEISCISSIFTRWVLTWLRCILFVYLLRKDFLKRRKWTSFGASVDPFSLCLCWKRTSPNKLVCSKSRCPKRRKLTSFDQCFETSL